MEAMISRPLFLALGTLFVIVLFVYGGFRIVLWLKPSIIALAKVWGG
jgi:hypothetical protein